MKTMIKLGLGSLVILACSLQGITGGAEAASKNYGPAPGWNLPDSTGKASIGSAYKGKVVIVDFWATWCPPCKVEVPGVVGLQRKYGPQGLQVVGFSMDNDPETHKKWLVANKVNYPSVYLNTPAGQKVMEAFGKVIGPIEVFPTTVVIDRKGNVVFTHLGLAQPEEFEKIIKPLLKA